MSNLSLNNLNICMVCDFFYPSLGGVENAIYQLSSYLQRLGHNVIILTHFYKNRNGIRYMSNGIKVYYSPFIATKVNIIYPTVGLATFDYIRTLAISEKIDIFHCHCSTSLLMEETIFIASCLKIPVITTDHSLFAFNDFACTNINKVIASTYKLADHHITVSYIGKENLIERTGFKADKFTVIPNCIDFSRFKPKVIENKIVIKSETQKFNPNKIPINKEFTSTGVYINFKKVTLVSISRQTFRKGTDLLIEVIPILYKIFPNMNFIIGGDGDKKYLLDKMVDYFKLHDRVELTGGIAHSKVKEKMLLGDIYLNTSLTEAFCIAILEAASTGLFVVSTNIGGVAEVLPEHMRILVDSNKDQIIEAIIHSVENLDTIKKHSSNYHLELSDKYNWYKNALVTEKIYKNCVNSDKSYFTTTERIFSNGGLSAVFLFFIFLTQIVLLLFLSIFKSEKSIIKNHKINKFDKEKFEKFLSSKNN